MSKQFSNPLDDDLWDDFELAGNEPQSLPSQATRPPAKTGMGEAVFYSTHGRPDTSKRPMQGNYQYVTLLLPKEQADRLRKLAEVYKMKFQPFMRWVIDRFALLYEDGARPSSDEVRGKERVPVLVAPVMVDVLKSWAEDNRMKLQPFVRWAMIEFLSAYKRDGLRPEEPERFIPDEAALFHWASRTVEKYDGTGVGKDQ